MRKPLNKEYIQGRVYEHDLAIKQVQNRESQNFGKDFIRGSLDIVTDDEGTNVVSVFFTYVSPLTSKQTKNDTFYALKNIIENGKSVIVDGFEAATKVKVDTALALNDFYTNKNGEDTLVSAKRSEGGFVHIVDKLTDKLGDRNKFEVDMLINGTKFVEADEEKHIEQDYLIVKGAVFNFKEEMLPVEFHCYNPAGIKYFESLDASSTNLVFTKVWGQILTRSISYEKVEESAFGEPVVKEYSRELKEWVIAGAAPEAYEIGDETNGITPEEIKQKMADREVYLAKEKQRTEEYRAQKANESTPSGSFGAAGVTAAQGGFNF